MPGGGVGYYNPQQPAAPAPAAPVAPRPAGSPAPGNYAAYYQGLSPEEFAARAAAEARAAGPTYLQKWETAMPNSYQLGGSADTANAYAAQAQATGQGAANGLNQSAMMSQGVGMAAGENLGMLGESAVGYGQQNAYNIGQYAQGQAANLDAYGRERASRLSDYARQQAGGLQQAGQDVYGQGQDIAGRDAPNINLRGALNSAYQAGTYGQNLANIDAQEGPSAAQAQLQSGLNQAQSSNLALARSGRGWGGSAGAMAAAQQQNAAAGQEAANQSAILRAQEDAARRQRMSQQLSAAGQLSLGQSQAQLAQQQLSADVRQRQMQMNDQAQQGLYGLGLNAQQAAGQMGIQGVQAAGQLGLQGMQAGGQLGLAGMSQAAGVGQAGFSQGLEAQNAAGQLGLQGLQQGGQMQMNAGLIGLSAQQQALAAQQQQVANNMAYQNQMIGLHQGNQNYQAGQAQLNANAAANSQSRVDQYIGAGIQAAGMAAGALSDRDKKKDIEPANGELLVPAVDTSGNGGTGGYNWGTGISGPGQAQASADAAQAASVQSPASLASANGGKMAGAIGGAGQKVGAMIGGRQPIMNAAPQAFYTQPVAIPQAQMPGLQLSDEREKESLAAIEQTPGFSYNYKDPDAMGAEPGRQYGIMAQDLEKTEAGRSVVKRQPDGTRMVDTSRLALLEAGAMNALTKKVAELEAKVAEAKKRKTKAA